MTERDFRPWTSVRMAWAPDLGRNGRRRQQRLIASAWGTLFAHKT